MSYAPGQISGSGPFIRARNRAPIVLGVAATGTAAAAVPEAANKPDAANPAAWTNWRLSVVPVMVAPPSPASGLSPGEIVIAERQIAITLAGDLEDGVTNCRLNRGAAVVAHAVHPMPGVEEPDIDLGRCLADSRKDELVEIMLHNAAFLDRTFLVHRVIEEPHDLALDLLSHRQRIDQAESLLMRDVDAFDTDFSILADGNRVHHGADRRHAVTLGAMFFQRNATCRPFRQRLAPARHFGRHVQRLDHIGFVRKIGARDQLAAVKIWVLARGMGEFIHECFAIISLRRRTDAAACADRDVKLTAVGREAVIWCKIAWRHIKAGGLTGGIHVGCRPDFHRNRPSIAIERGTQASDTDRPESRADEVFLARPQHVNRRAAVLVGDVNRLFCLRSVAIAAVAAAEMAQMDIYIVLGNSRDAGARATRLLRALIAEPDVHPV